MLGRLEVWLGQSLALELGSRMRIVDETHSKHEEMGKDWTQLERPGPSWPDVLHIPEAGRLGR